MNMGRLYCRCLNVVVHHSGEVETGRLVPAVTLLPEQSRDPLVGQQLLELELDVAGVVTVSKHAVVFVTQCSILLVGLYA